MRDTAPSAAVPRRITLLTDFGTSDGYVAAMRGIIAGIAPHALVDDASHDLPHGDVHAAAFALARYARHYPPDTVHVVVVDPGVGSARRPLAARIDAHFFVAPDNGVLTRVLSSASGARLVELKESAYLRAHRAPTFHGRDVFAPAAAHLAAGTALDDLGPPVVDPVLLAVPAPVRTGSEVHGEVVGVDRFGNLITNIPRAWIPADAYVRVAGQPIGRLHAVYADVATGAVVALINSDDVLEIGVRDDSAARTLGIVRGAPVKVELPAV